jgi:DNA-binding Lrp family transcriptional regulator
VTECHVVMGEDDFLLKIMVADLNDFQKFLLDHLTAIPGLSTVISSAVLRQVKSTTELPV